MSYQVQLTRQAVKHIRALPASDQVRIKEVLQEMQVDPLAGDVQKLRGYDAYRRRVRSYRIIFSVQQTELVVLVFDVLRRNENTYKNL